MTQEDKYEIYVGNLSRNPPHHRIDSNEFKQSQIEYMMFYSCAHSTHQCILGGEWNDIMIEI